MINNEEVICTTCCYNNHVLRIICSAWFHYLHETESLYNSLHPLIRRPQRPKPATLMHLENTKCVIQAMSPVWILKNVSSLWVWKVREGSMDEIRFSLKPRGGLNKPEDVWKTIIVTCWAFGSLCLSYILYKCTLWFSCLRGHQNGWGTLFKMHSHGLCMPKKNLLWGWRDSLVVESVDFSSRGLELDSQDSCWAAQNCL